MILSGKKVIMIGDSITDCERARPIGEGKGDNSLGRGYVAQLHAMLEATYPTLDMRMINMGIGGNTVRELKTRWQTDVIDLRPDWVSIMIGINDVARHYNRRLMKEWHVSLEEFETTLSALVEESKAAEIQKIVLMTPFFIETNPNDQMRIMTLEYGAAVKRISEKHGTIYIDVQAAFDVYLKHHHPTELAADRIHPSQTGHMIIAREWLKSVGYTWL